MKRFWYFIISLSYLLFSVVYYQLLSEKSSDLACFVYIDSLSSRYFRESWHGHDLACEGYDEACTCGNLEVTYSNFEVCRCTKFCLVVGQAVLCLSYADRAVAKSECFKLFCLFLSICCQNNSLTAVYFLYDLVQFVFDRAFQLICSRWNHPAER